MTTTATNKLDIEQHRYPPDLVQQQLFKSKGYAMMRNVLDKRTLDILASYAMLQRYEAGRYDRDNDRAALGMYADSMGESLLVHLQSAVEAATGLTLLPCYSYLRIYGPNGNLRRHTDRPPAEIQTTLTIAGKAPAVWPLNIEVEGEVIALDVGPGDLAMFRGFDIPHWRDKLNGEFWIQMILNYVDAGGEYAKFRFDRRPHIGPPEDRAAFQKKLADNDPCPCGSGDTYINCHGQKSRY